MLTSARCCSNYLFSFGVDGPGRWLKKGVGAFLVVELADRSIARIASLVESVQR